MSRDVGGVRLVGLAAREIAPERDRAEHEVRDERRRDRDAREHRSTAPVTAREPGRAEHRSGDQRRDQPGRVVVVDRALRVRRREEVEPELGNRCDEHERGGGEEEQERQEEVGEVVDPLRVERRAQDRAGIGEDRRQDLPRRVAESPVALLEARRGARVEVRQDDLDARPRSRARRAPRSPRPTR